MVVIVRNRSSSLDQVISRGPFPAQLFCDSMILWFRDFLFFLFFSGFSVCQYADMENFTVPPAN